jgi:hypothetical protein
LAEKQESGQGADMATALPSRSTYEAYTGIILGAVQSLAPMNIFLRVAIDVILLLIVADLILRSHWTMHAHWAKKTALFTIVVVVLTALQWRAATTEIQKEFPKKELAKSLPRITAPPKPPPTSAPSPEQTTINAKCVINGGNHSTNRC